MVSLTNLSVSPNVHVHYITHNGITEAILDGVSVRERTVSPGSWLCHSCHDLLQYELCVSIAGSYVGVILGGDRGLQLLEAVEEPVGEVKKRWLGVGVCGGDELVEVVVYEGGLEAEVLVDIVGGLFAEQVLQRQQVEGRAAHPVGVRREARPDVRHVDAVLHEGSRPCLAIVDLLVADLGHRQGELGEPPAVIGRLRLLVAVSGGAGGCRVEHSGGGKAEA